MNNKNISDKFDFFAIVFVYKKLSWKKFSFYVKKITLSGYGGIADALGLGPSGRNPVGVQIPLPAHF